jgi:hypothetical protein
MGDREISLPQVLRPRAVPAAGQAGKAKAK